MKEKLGFWLGFFLFFLFFEIDWNEDDDERMDLKT